MLDVVKTKTFTARSPIFMAVGGDVLGDFREAGGVE